MKRATLMVVAATLLAVLAWGCGEDPTCTNCPLPDLLYLPQTSPANVVNNLATSWEHRHIEPYANLLAPDFRFYFQQSDLPPGLQRDYWNRDEDSTGTGGLFGATAQVLSISVELGTFAVEDSVRVDQPDVKRIRLTRSKLEVKQSNGVTFQVEGYTQEFYFRKGRSEEGTDPTRWYIFEWHDISGGGSLDSPGWHPERGAHQEGTAPAGALIQPATWGRIKSNF